MNPSSRVAQLCAISLIASSAGFGAVYAHKVGIEHSPLLAVLSVTMAFALEGLKPVAVKEAISSFASLKLIRGMLLSLLAMVAITYSLTSELALVSLSKGDMTAKRQDTERLRNELSAMGITRPSKAIRAELDAILGDRRLNNCEGWLENWKLRAICIEKVQPLRSEYAKAERRETIEAKLNGATGGTADPGSSAVAHYLTAMGYRFEPGDVATWLLLVPVLALELGSALALVVVQTPLRQNHPKNQGEVGTTVPLNHEPRTTKPVVLKPIHATIEPRAQALAAFPAPPRTISTTDALVLDHLKANGGSLLASERAMAMALGVDRSTLRRTVHSLATAGQLVIVQTSKRGTHLQLM